MHIGKGGVGEGVFLSSQKASVVVSTAVAMNTRH